MGYKIGFSIGYGIVFLAYEAIVFLLTGFTRPGAWLGLACTVLVLGLCLAAVWKDAFQAGIAHLPMVLGVVLTIFICASAGGGRHRHLPAAQMGRYCGDRAGGGLSALRRRDGAGRQNDCGTGAGKPRQESRVK